MPAGKKQSERFLTKNEIYMDILTNALQVAHVSWAALRYHLQTGLKLAPNAL